MDFPFYNSQWRDTQTVRGILPTILTIECIWGKYLASIGCDYHSKLLFHATIFCILLTCPTVKIVRKRTKYLICKFFTIYAVLNIYFHWYLYYLHMMYCGEVLHFWWRLSGVLELEKRIRTIERNVRVDNE